MENKKIRNATPTEYKGVTYRSGLEAECAKIFEENGVNVQYEPFKLTTDTPDFVGEGFIVECKGFPNDNWHDKRKWIMNYLLKDRPNLRFYEVHTVTQLRTLLKSIKTGLKEEWRPVVGFVDLYEVSNLGDVRSLQFHGKRRTKMMVQSTNKLGYKFVKLRDWHHQIVGTFPVHRLVAQSFIPNLEDKPQVDHIDTNPSNNVVTNLRWVTPRENQNNPLTLNRLQNSLVEYNKSEAHRKVVQQTQGHSVLQYDRHGKLLGEFPSMNEAAAALGTTACCIKRVCDGVRHYHKNWVFKYKSNMESPQVQKIRKLIPSLPEKDIPIGNKLLEARDWEELQNLVSSAIVKIEKANDKGSDKYTNIDIGSLYDLQAAIPDTYNYGSEETF